MTLTGMIILGLLLILIIQILEVYLTLKLNHEMDDEIKALDKDCEEDREALDLRLKALERKDIMRKDKEHEEEESE